MKTKHNGYRRGLGKAMIAYFSRPMEEEFTDGKGTKKKRRTGIPTMRGFCDEEGIDSVRTLARFAEEHPAFRRDYERAREMEKNVLVVGATLGELDGSMVKYLLSTEFGDERMGDAGAAENLPVTDERIVRMIELAEKRK